MSTSSQLIAGILFYLFSLIFHSRFHKLFLFISSAFILFSIFNLEINSYSSDLLRYSDLNFIAVKQNFRDDFLFYKVSFFINQFFDNGKAAVLFWQLLIFFNFIYAEKLVLDLTKVLKVKYVEGLFIFTIFITVGIQTIFNQIRYGVVYSFFILIILFLIKYFYLKKRKYIYYSVSLILISLGIHKLATFGFSFIPLFLFCFYKVINFQRINLFKTRVLSVPISILLLITFLFIFYLFNLRIIQETISYIPVLDNFAIIRATDQYLNRPLENYFMSFIYSFINILISYRAVHRLPLFKNIELLRVLLFLSILSTSFLLIPLGSRITSLYIFLPLPFYVSFSRISLSYFFKSYYILITFFNILRFNAIFPPL